MEYIIFFAITYVVTYLISFITIIRKNTSKKNKNSNKDRIPVEVQYLIKRYGLDISKLDYAKFLNTVCLVGSFDMALAVTIILKIKSIILQIIIAFLVLIPIIYISYRILGKYYQKKGMIKNEYEGNRK